MTFNNLDHSKTVLCDIECYKNYFLVMFRRVSDGNVISFESINDSEINIKNILHIIKKYTVITFNGNSYDVPVLQAICSGFNNNSVYSVSKRIIEEGLKPWQVRKQLGIREITFDHIDLIEIAPLKASLKIYGGRIQCPKMKDLPIHPDALIKESDLEEMKLYCGNDLEMTELLLRQLEGEIQLRINISNQYDVDVRSKSDSQIAEALIKKEMEAKYGISPKRPKVEPGTEYFYKPPSNLSFQTEQLQDVFKQYTTRPFVVGLNGYVEFNFEMIDSDRKKSGKNKGEFPSSKKKMQFTIGDTAYTVGTGGLHSCEKSTRHTNENCILRDYDVASYYPNIILNNGLCPKHLGKPFLDIYSTIVARRLKAKAEGDKVVNESLKITINGSFGKFGNKWSCLYSPDLMIQVTVTGQLSLLMLIERLELIGVSVVSANTDGIVVKIPFDKEDETKEIIEEWEFETDYEMESSDYVSLNSRDVNNYIAVKKDSVKGKGAYVDQSSKFSSLRNNPTNNICVEAAKKFLSNNKPIEKTIKECKDIRKFVTVRTVNGGAVKDGRLIGKAIRWYQGAYELDAIHYSTSGNKVPKSDGGVPIMDLSDTLPDDIDFDWYIEETKKILKNVGCKNI